MEYRKEREDMCTVNFVSYQAFSPMFVFEALGSDFSIRIILQ